MTVSSSIKKLPTFSHIYLTGLLKRWRDGWVGWMDGFVNGWMDGYIYIYIVFYTHTYIIYIGQSIGIQHA